MHICSNRWFTSPMVGFVANQQSQDGQVPVQGSWKEEMIGKKKWKAARKNGSHGSKFLEKIPIEKIEKISARKGTCVH